MEPKPTHTPEPWHVEPSARFMDASNITNASDESVVIHATHANAARIVACVNACKGISTDDLVDIFQHMDDYRRLKALAVLANDAASDQ